MRPLADLQLSHDIIISTKQKVKYMKDKYKRYDWHTIHGSFI